MQRINLFWFSIGFLIGVVVLLGLWRGKPDLSRQKPVTPGVIRQTAVEVGLFQAGKPVGHFDSGVRIWERSPETPGVRHQLLLKWEQTGNSAEVLRPVATDGAPVEQKALATFRKRASP